jgi:hypothetical protein
VLYQTPHWTLAFLTNNYWLVAGHSNLDKPAVNQFLLQYFINYNLKKGYYPPLLAGLTSCSQHPGGYSRRLRA